MRPITVEDIPTFVKGLLSITSESEFYLDMPQDYTYTTEYLKSLIESDVFVGWIVPDKGYMFGVLGQSWYSPRLDFYEYTLFVFPEHRGGTTAVRLIKRMERSAKDAGCHTFYAGSTTGMNDERTLRMYELLGFKRDQSHGVRKVLQSGN